VLPGTTWLYFALCQFPIYLSPQLLKPVVRRLSVRAATVAGIETGDA
jgi:BASS family bile acid:Na+ symporter